MVRKRAAFPRLPCGCPDPGDGVCGGRCLHGIPALIGNTEPLTHRFEYLGVPRDVAEIVELQQQINDIESARMQAIVLQTYDTEQPHEPFPEDPRAPKPRVDLGRVDDFAGRRWEREPTTFGEFPIVVDPTIQPGVIKMHHSTRRQYVSCVEDERRYTVREEVTSLLDSLPRPLPRDTWDSLRWPRESGLGFGYVEKITITDDVIRRVEEYPEGWAPTNEHYQKNHVNAPGTVRSWFRQMRAAEFCRDTTPSFLRVTERWTLFDTQRVVDRETAAHYPDPDIEYLSVAAYADFLKLSAEKARQLREGSWDAMIHDAHEEGL